MIDWAWIGSHIGEIAARTGEHVLLTVVALVVGFGLSMLLAWLAWIRPGSYGPITWTAGILYTIPSIALFAVSLVSVEERQAYPLQVRQVVRSESEKAAAKARRASSKERTGKT